MQAIITKYIPATNTRSSKILAKCERAKAFFDYDHGLDISDNHRAACDQLCARFDAQDAIKYGSLEKIWSRPKASGQIPSGEYVFCFIPDRVYKRGGAK